ncbi:MAG: AmmeMemoRadiSam system protein B [Candidatus Kerfeldbacteria bacterium]|nr:AmmeMemoRadiSam system protein B [Candidatus Kerfeldbacteria bacterium]
MGRLAVGTIGLLLLLAGCAVESTIQPEVVVEQIVAPAVPLVVVLPHHDVVATQRRELLETVSQQSQPDTIILIAPNHFAAGQASIQTTDRIWTLAGGNVHLFPNVPVIDALVTTGVASLEDSSFINEHGIKNVLADLHDAFPTANLVPIIFKDTVSTTQIEELMQTLVIECSDCGLIASVDMSHYNPAAVADIHDIKTLRDLTELNEDDIWNTEIDSTPSLAVLLAWAQQQNTEQFVLTDHTNSGGDETTSHIMGYYTAGTVTDYPDQLTFTFAGDMMLGREIGYQFQNNNFQDLFSNFGNRVFWGTDIAWANLEGPLSDVEVVQDRQPDDLVFLFSKQGISALTYLKLTTIGLANNHGANHGRAGLDTTRQVVEAAGLDWVGDPYGINETSVKRYSVDDIAVSLIATNSFDGDQTGLTELITQERDSGNFVIVLPHWGNEYQTTHSSRQESLATDWIAAGAGLIIGMHPHVVQDAQVIEGKLVIYSLGNFVFDQTFSKETQQGLIVTGTISEDELKLVLVPIVDRSLKPQLATGGEKQALVDRICGNIQEYCADGLITIGR